MAGLSVVRLEVRRVAHWAARRVEKKVDRKAERLVARWVGYSVDLKAAL